MARRLISAFTRVFDTLVSGVHARLRHAMGRCTAGPGHKIAKTTPCKVEWAPARSTRAALRSGQEKKNGPSSRPGLISSRSSLPNTSVGVSVLKFQEEESES